MNEQASPDKIRALRDSLRTHFAEAAAVFASDLYRACMHQLGGLPSYSEGQISERDFARVTRQQPLLTGALKSVLSADSPEGSYDTHYKYRVDPAALAEICKRAAQEECPVWLEKTVAKLGAVTLSRIVWSGAQMRVYASRKNGAEHVRLDQHRAWRCSPNGRIFVQYSARLHLEDRHVSEAQYKAA